MSCKHAEPLRYAFSNLTYFELEGEDFPKSTDEEYVCRFYNPECCEPYDNVKLRLIADKNEVAVSDDNTGSLFTMRISDKNMDKMSLEVNSYHETEGELSVNGFESNHFIPHSEAASSGPQRLYCSEQTLNGPPNATINILIDSYPFMKFTVAEIRCFTADTSNQQQRRRLAVKLNRHLERACKMTVLALALKIAVVKYRIKTSEGKHEAQKRKEEVERPEYLEEQLKRLPIPKYKGSDFLT